MKEIQKAVIKKGNKYLVLLRSPRALHFPGFWDFPGGKLEANEDRFAGIEREVFEETQIKVKALKAVTSYEYDLDGVGKPTHRFTLFNVKIISKNDVQLSDEHLEYRWATKDEVKMLEKVEPYIKPFFEMHAKA